MSSINIRIPEERKQEIEDTAERENYSSPSEWVREAIREKLKRDTALYPEEVNRFLEIWQKEERDELELTPSSEVWNEHGV